MPSAGRLPGRPLHGARSGADELLRSRRQAPTTPPRRRDVVGDALDHSLAPSARPRESIVDSVESDISV